MKQGKLSRNRYFLTDDDMKRFLVYILFLLPSAIFAQEYSDWEIWNAGKYSAFTSLLYVNNRFYCAFREASAHRAFLDKNDTMGEIVLISSSDGIRWEICARLQEAKCDLRDPKLSLTPDGRLMLLYCRRTYGKISGTPTTFVTFFDLESQKMLPPLPITITGYDKQYKWLWEVVWHKGEAYGFMYGNYCFCVNF